jgi:hypothetical protein
MPDLMSYDESNRRLRIGDGYVENVEKDVWLYEVSGKQILPQWFSYRRAHRDRPIIGERRTPSSLGNIQPEHWLPDYTSELINVLNVLGLLINIAPQQAEVLEKICSGPLIAADDLRLGGALDLPPKGKKSPAKSKTADLFGG